MKNIYITEGNITTLIMSKGSAIIDTEDLVKCNERHWFITPDRKYVTSKDRGAKNRKSVLLHKYLTGFSITDHINGNGLDNRRSNLREVNHSKNAMNRNQKSKHGFKGVYSNGNSRFFSTIFVNKKSKYLGIYGSPEEAAKAYDLAATEYFGEYARLNFPEDLF